MLSYSIKSYSPDTIYFTKENSISIPDEGFNLVKIKIIKSISYHINEKQTNKNIKILRIPKYVVVFKLNYLIVLIQELQSNLYLCLFVVLDISLTAECETTIAFFFLIRNDIQHKSFKELQNDKLYRNGNLKKIREKYFLNKMINQHRNSNLFTQVKKQYNFSYSQTIIKSEIVLDKVLKDIKYTQNQVFRSLIKTSSIAMMFLSKSKHCIFICCQPRARLLLFQKQHKIKKLNLMISHLQIDLVQDLSFNFKIQIFLFLHKNSKNHHLNVIIIVIDNLLAIHINSSIIQIIRGLELLISYINIWGEIINNNESLRKYLNGFIIILNRWLILNLVSCTKMLEHINSNHFKGSRRFWHRFFELIFLTKSDNAMKNVGSLIDDFVLKALIGEFNEKLTLIYIILCQTNTRITSLPNSLSNRSSIKCLAIVIYNLYKYYSQLSFTILLLIKKSMQHFETILFDITNIVNLDNTDHYSECIISNKKNLLIDEISTQAKKQIGLSIITVLLDRKSEMFIYNTKTNKKK
jgi:hypothetical protein